jgi:hypothetical protein
MHSVQKESKLMRNSMSYAEVTAQKGKCSTKMNEDQKLRRDGVIKLGSKDARRLHSGELEI